jgi:hypothetical protein
MTDYIEKYWALYVAGLLLCFLALVLWGLAWQDKARTAYCQDRGMVRVETPAGERCAPLWALERIAR